MSAFEDLRRKIHSDANAIVILDRYHIDVENISVGMIDGIEDDLYHLDADGYRAILPSVFCCIERFGMEAALATSVESFLDLPQSQFRTAKFSGGKLIDELKASNTYSAGWIAPALASLDAVELDLTRVTIEELLSKMDDEILSYFERVLPRLASLIDMAAEPKA